MTTVHDILKVSCEHYGLTPVVALRFERMRTAVRARDMAIYIARETLGLPLGKIANSLGRSDRKTAWFAVRRIEEKMDSDPTIAEDLEAIQAKVMAGVEEGISELVSDLDAIIKDSRDGATIRAIAEWFGISQESALNLAELAVATGRARPVFKAGNRFMAKIEPIL